MAKEKRQGNTFAGYQEDKQKRRESLIKAYISLATKSRQNFKFVTDMAKAVAMHISAHEKREGFAELECNPSTILRNPRYKLLLLGYLSGDGTTKLLDVNKTSTQANQVASTRSLLAQLETSNLRLENQRLKYHIAELENALEIKTADVAVPKDEPKDGHKDDLLLFEMEDRYIRTCQALMALVSEFKEILVLDVGNRRILDPGMRRGDKVIVEERLAAPFFDWLKKHAASMRGA